MIPAKSVEFLLEAQVVGAAVGDLRESVLQIFPFQRLASFLGLGDFSLEVVQGLLEGC